MKILSLLGTLFCFNLAQAATYYISPTGNNTNPGTQASPWQTIVKANGTFAAGDIVLFEGGQTFTGTLTPASSGTSANRITFGSYGTGRATISSAAAGGLVINGRSFVTVQNLIFRGNWQNATNTAVLTANNTAIGVRLYRTPTNILLDNLKISGYGSFGVEAQSADTNITITRFEIHDNKDTGIEFRVLTGASKHTNVILSDGSVYRNRGWATPNSSGNGIRLASANGAMIERCIAYENGKECTTTGGGPVGIWSWRSNNVIIQYCIAYRNGTAGLWDGGGFDIDGGDGNCIMQYNYSFENEGAGFLFAAFANADGVNNGVLRYNLSVNDATKGVARNQSSIHVWNASGNSATTIQNVYIYNNTVIQTGNASAGSCFQTADGALTNVRVFNNIFIAGNGRLTTMVNQTTGVSMQGNLYYRLDNAADAGIRWGGSTYSTLAAFRSATGQEMLSGNPVGLHANPNLNNAAAVPPVLTAWSQTATQLNPWKLNSSSPARNSSISAVSLIGATTSSTTYGAGTIAHPGTKDLFDTTLPASSLIDIGMHELVASSTIIVSPSGSSVALGGNITFSGLAYDSAGALISPQPTMTWSVNGSGTINSSSGVFTATATGSYTVTATGGGLTGTGTATVTYGVGTGTGILREWWTGISAGTSVASLLTDTNTFANVPTGSVVIGSGNGGLFEGPTNFGDNYGQRFRGWFLPPATGTYTFVIASDDSSELWLSTNATVANAVKIASVINWTNSREWTKEENQTSVPVSLVAGQSYYIEARHKEGGGGDNVAVGVTLPGGVAEQPIPSHRLTPWTSAPPTAVSDPVFSPAAGTYSSTQSVTISTATSGATIRYTNDGSTPTSSTGTVYSSAISVSATTTLKAIAYKSGLTDSAVVTAAYTITPPGAEWIYQPFADASGTASTAMALVTGVTSHSGTGTVQTASALTYTNVASSGNGLTTANGSRFFMSLNTALPSVAPYVSGGMIGGTGTGVLYVSWLAKGILPNSSTTFDFRTGNGTALPTVDETTVSVGTTAANDFIRAMSANALNSGWQNYSNSTVAPTVNADLYVAKFTFGAGNTSRVDVYVNQTTEGTPTVTTTGFAQFNTLSFANFGTAAAPLIDEIRMAGTFAAVVPSSGASLTGVQTFRTTYGLASNGSGDSLTPAGDGVENLLKYAFNMLGTGTGQVSTLTTPNAAVLTANGTAGLPFVSLLPAPGSQLEITYIRRKATANPAPGITNAVEFSEDLVSWAVDPLATETTVIDLDATFERVTVTDNVASPAKRFVRVRITAPQPTILL